jgi:mono/diheme cytochrome c family protein
MSVATLAACMVLVLLTAPKTAQTSELAAAPAAAAALLQSGSGGQSGSGSGSDNSGSGSDSDNSGSGSGDDGDGNPIEGRRIFMRENCYSCHGGFAGGGFCPSLREPRPDEDEVREVIRNGTRNGMPPFPELRERDIENLAAYFQTLRTRREPTFTHWWEPVPTQ